MLNAQKLLLKCNLNYQISMMQKGIMNRLLNYLYINLLQKGN